MNDTKTKTVDELLGDSPVARSIKEWIEKLQRPLDTLVAFGVYNDITDVTKEYDDGWMHKIPGPYTRFQLTFKDGAIKYGKCLYHANGPIQDDKDGNYGYEWIRQKRHVIHETQ